VQIIIAQLTEIATQHRPRRVVQVFRRFFCFIKLVKVYADCRVLSAFKLHFKLDPISVIRPRNGITVEANSYDDGRVALTSSD